MPAEGAITDTKPSYVPGLANPLPCPTALNAAAGYEKRKLDERFRTPQWLAVGFRIEFVSSP